MALDGRIHCRFEFDGKSYDYHGEGGFTEYKLVKVRAGLSLLRLPDAVVMGDVDALLALVWLGMRAAGEDVSWDEVADRLTDPQALVSTIVPIDPPAEPKPAVKPKGRKAVAEPADDAEPAPAT